MLTLYEKIEELCKNANINITDMCKNANISRSILSDYKMGRTKSISTDTIEKIANYFDVSVDYLLGKTDIKKSSYSEEQEEMAELLQEFRDNPELRTLFSLTSKATPADLRKMINVIKAMKGNGYGDY